MNAHPQNQYKNGGGDSNPSPQIHNALKNKALTENAESVLSDTLSDARTETLKNHPELIVLIERWDTLPESVRKQIIELAGASGQ